MSCFTCHVCPKLPRVDDCWDIWGTCAFVGYIWARKNISGDISMNKYKEGTYVDKPQELNLELKHRSTNKNIMAY